MSKIIVPIDTSDLISTGDMEALLNEVQIIMSNAATQFVTPIVPLSQDEIDNMIHNEIDNMIKSTGPLSTYRFAIDWGGGGSIPDIDKDECKCDIKALMSYGHNKDCPDYESYARSRK